MSFIVTCECGKQFQVRDEQLGKKGQCKNCGRVLLLAPEGYQAPAPSAAAPPPPEAPGYDPNYGAGATAADAASFDNPLDNIDWSAVEAADKEAKAAAAKANPTAAYIQPTGGPATPSTPMAPAMPRQRPCPACGQIISARALRCEFCGAVLDPRVAGAMAAQASGRSSGGAIGMGGADDQMNAIDWVLCIIGCGCIVGIVYLVQGKSKGGKMIMWGLIFNAVGGAIRFAISQATSSE